MGFINVLAVLVVALITMAIGMLWYGPFFGKRWMKLAGISKKSGADMKKKMISSTISGLVAAIFTSLILALFVGFVGAATFVDGVLVGALAWFGFVAMTQLGSVLWEGKPVELFLLNTAYSFVTLAIAGGILAVWV